MKILIALLALTTIILQTGCAHCTGDPRIDSGSCIIFQEKALKEFIAEKQQYLNTLNEQLSVLDDELLTSQAELFSLQKSLATAEIPTKELEALRKETADLQSQADTLALNIINQKEKVKSLEVAIQNSQQNNQQLELELVQAKKDTQNMQKTYDIIKAGIKRSAAIKLKYSSG